MLFIAGFGVENMFTTTGTFFLVPCKRGAERKAVSVDEGVQ